MELTSKRRGTDAFLVIMKKLIKFYVLTFFIVFSATFCWSADDISPKEIYKRNQEAVGIVIAMDKNNKPLAQGSGFFCKSDGAFVTNIHVIKDADSVIIKLQNGAIFIVEEYIGYDNAADIVILKVDGKNLPYLEFGNSYELEAGEEVLAIGSPRGLENSISSGIVSAIRNIEEKDFRFIQTTAEVSPGSSGGPLFNKKGQVVGVTTFIIGQGEALTFAVPIERVQIVLNQQKSENLNEKANIDNNERYYYLAGIVARDVENYEDAAKYFAKAITLNQRFDKPYYELADIYDKQRKFKEQKIIFEKLVSLRPMDARAHHNYAVTLESTNEEIAAIREYKTALKFEPDNQDTLFNIGFLYILHGNYSEAKEIIAKLKTVNDRWANQLERMIEKLIEKNGGVK
ncbi:MAG: trypsin-like peptidase domain-containing protein [Candidatus Omnitrophica bacterium]|jgi:tetratricopeptide (TPR) repeat protein|nr:trypsin-like peptidase domain-containing protein [Candidatus Omnitrophota bacterium]